MPERTQCKKDAKGQYDPQVGAAAAANSALAERSQAWTEDFYAKYVAPALDVATKSTQQNDQRQGDLFDLNMSQTKLQDQRYRDLGLPAEDRYYKMVDEYSAPAEEERQASAALGDVRTAKENNRAQTMRRFSGLGIDPTSPAALAAVSDNAVNDAALEAAASTRARSAAKSLGMSLTGDAANFGRGGASGVLQFGAAAGGNAASAATIGQAGVGATTAGAAPTQNAFGIAQRAYGSNLDAYAGLNKASMEASAAASGGFGKLIGVLGQGALTAAFPPAAAASDRRLKKHAQKLMVMANGLAAYMFHMIWDADTAPFRFGYMADEVKRLFPHAVSEDTAGYMSVDYSKVPA